MSAASDAVDLAARQREILHLLVSEYYKVVDPKLATYCVINAAIMVNALLELGLTPVLQPCQMIYCSEAAQFIVGFADLARADQWDGHVIVRVGDFLIDTSLQTFRKYFGLIVPYAVGTNRLAAPSNLIGAVKVGDGAQLLWVAPPANADRVPPEAPRPVVERFSRALVAHLRAMPGPI